VTVTLTVAWRPSSELPSRGPTCRAARITCQRMARLDASSQSNDRQALGQGWPQLAPEQLARIARSDLRPLLIRQVQAIQRVGGLAEPHLRVVRSE